MAQTIGLKLDWRDSMLLSKIKGAANRLRWAVVLGTNAAIKEVQQAEYADMRKHFIVRKPEFFFGTPGMPGGAAGRVTMWASISQAVLYAELSVRASTFSGTRRLLLADYEEGGPREPFVGKSVAVPMLGRPARPNIAREVPPQFTFAGLAFRPYRGTHLVRRKKTSTWSGGIFGEFGRLDLSRTSDYQWKGRERTFILMHSAREPFGGVFQRIGPGRGDIRLIYAFVRGMQLKKRLYFYEIARATAQPAFKKAMRREIDKAFQHGASS